MSHYQNSDLNWVEVRLLTLYCDANTLDYEFDTISGSDTPLDILLVHEKMITLELVAKNILNSREYAAYTFLLSGEANSFKHAGELTGLSKMAIHRLVKKLSKKMEKALDC